MVGDIFPFSTTTRSGLRAFFTNNFTNYTPISSPTIGWSKQHAMVRDIFFGTSTPSGLRAFDVRNSIQWLGTFFLSALPPLLDLERWMLETAYNGWVHFCFLALPPFLSLQHFLQIISQIILQFHPQPLDARNSIQWLGTFFLALPPILDLEHFLQIISQIILQFHPQPLDGQNSNQWLGTFFFWALPPLLDLEHWMLETASNGWGHFFGHYHPFWT